MIHIKNVLDRVTPLGAAATLLLSVAVPALAFHQASAAALTERSLMVTSTVASDDLTAPDGTTYTGLAAGDPRNGAQVGHTYSFKVGTAGTVQGFTIEYCNSAFGFVGTNACAGAPSGFSAADWDNKTVTIKSVAFNVDATANTLTLSHSTGVSVTSGEVITIAFPVGTGYFVNPNIAYRGGSQNGTYFAHIATYATEAAAQAGIASDSGYVDDGTVTNNVTNGIGIYTRVQETLNFSVEGDAASQNNSGAGTPSTTPSGTSCPALTGTDNNLHLGDVNSALVPGQANKVSSYFRLSTNASNGTAVHYSGDTLKNNNHTFTSSAIGGEAYANDAERFGIGINATSPNTSLTHLTNITTGYGDAGTDSYAYNVGSVATPVAIASTAAAPNQTIVTCDTAQVDYMASIAPDTPAGIYQTKINYIASPKY